MEMRVHEIHPALIHGPLVLLPTASILDIVAAASGDARVSALAEKLWIAGSVSGLVAGLAGMAASQEVRPSDGARETLFIHGLGNLGLVATAVGITAWRARNPASMVTGVLGLAASTAALFTAYLGGEMVYGHGLGVRSLTGMADSPKVLSAQAPSTFARDAVAGAVWLLSSAWKRLVRKEAVPAPEKVQARQPSIILPAHPRVPAEESKPPILG